MQPKDVTATGFSIIKVVSTDSTIIACSTSAKGLAKIKINMFICVSALRLFRMLAELLEPFMACYYN